MSVSILAPEYCLNFGRLYSIKYVEAIFDKPEIEAQDLKSLLYYFDRSIRSVFTCAWVHIFQRFKDEEPKFRKFIYSEDESEMAYSSYFDCIDLYTRHFNMALGRYDILNPHLRTINDLIKSLSKYELAYLDRFVEDYAAQRGLYRKSAKNGVRTTSPYHTWVQQVKLRDSFICKRCGVEDDLVAHHIIPVSVAPEFATDINNGVTLCEKCHNSYHHSRNVKFCHANSLNDFINTYPRRRS